MQIHWNNIIAFILLVVTLILFGKNWPAVHRALTSITHIGPYHSTDDKVVGVVVLGLICLLIAALVKILTHGGDR